LVGSSPLRRSQRRKQQRYASSHGGFHTLTY
jgi:hypothetical protein